VQIKSIMGSEMSPHAIRGSVRERSGPPGHRSRRRRGQAELHATGARSDVRLTFPARPANVAVIRHVLGAFADALALPADLVEDMRLAVTEACTNVVRHAYEVAEVGMIDVVIRPSGDRLELIVSDQGAGIRPSLDDGSGLGLPMIAALADHVEIGPGPDRGTRVSMSFRCRPALGIV
jgi:anti-sigma regulatory factor (Ser/Thr protein kinase)